MILDTKSIRVRDNLLSAEQRKEVNNFLNRPGWKFGWKSGGKRDTFSFLHKHFAGPRGNEEGKKELTYYDCANELEKHPLIEDFWSFLSGGLLQGHTLVRCYANGFAFGMDGTLHRDDKRPGHYTSIFYPHERWSPNWGGETCFFNPEETDLVASIYPKPNRIVVFAGNVPHVARGLTRQCPEMRITLMFKTCTGALDGSDQTRKVPAPAVA